MSARQRRRVKSAEDRRLDDVRIAAVGRIRAEHPENRSYAPEEVFAHMLNQGNPVPRSELDIDHWTAAGGVLLDWLDRMRPKGLTTPPMRD